MPRETKTSLSEDYPQTSTMASSVGGTLNAQKGSIKRQLSEAIMAAKNADVDIPKLLKRQGVSVDGESDITSERLINMLEANEIPKAFIDRVKGFSVLQMAHGRNVTFKEVLVQPNDIEQKTAVASINPRGTDTIVESDVLDIVATYKDYPQQNNAYGYVDEGGTIRIAEGQRRRLALLVHNRDNPDNLREFKVWVTDERLTLADIKTLDTITETKLARSPLQQGRYWLKLWDEEFPNEDKLSYRKLAEFLGENYNIVKKYCGLASVNSKLILLAMYPASISVRGIQNVRTMGRKYSEELLEQCRAKAIKNLGVELTQLPITDANNKLLKEINELALLHTDGYDDGENGAVKSNSSTYKLAQEEPLKSPALLFSRLKQSKDGSQEIEYKLSKIPKDTPKEVLEKIQQRLSLIIEEELPKQ